MTWKLNCKKEWKMTLEFCTPRKAGFCGDRTFWVLLKEYQEGDLQFCSHEMWIHIQKHKRCHLWSMKILLVDSERMHLFLNSWLLHACCGSVSYHSPTLTAQLSDSQEVRPCKCFLLLLPKADREPVVFSGTLGVLDAVVKISFVYWLELLWKLHEYFGPLGYIRDRLGCRGLKTWQIWWGSLSSTFGQFCPVQSELNSLLSTASLPNLIPEKWSSALFYSWGHPRGSVWTGTDGFMLPCYHEMQLGGKGQWRRWGSLTPPVQDPKIRASPKYAGLIKPGKGCYLAFIIYFVWKKVVWRDLSES